MVLQQSIGRTSLVSVLLQSEYGRQCDMTTKDVGKGCR